jgi:anti-anti-sigma factor
MILSTTNRTHMPAGTMLHVVGEVDTFAADGLRVELEHLADEPSGAVVVDCTDVTFMSCTALTVLARAKAQLGPRLLLSGTSKFVTRLLAMTGLASFFPVLSEGEVRPSSDEPDHAANGSAPAIRTAEVRSWTFSRTDLHRARGLLMAIHGCDAEEAWSMLALAAARHGVPVGELVELLIRARRDPERPPSSAAADAALTVLTRKLVDGAADARVSVGCDAADGMPHDERLRST